MYIVGNKGEVMASMDYMHCVVCDCKTVYDGDVDYSNHREVRIISICGKCRETHDILIREKSTSITRTLEDFEMLKIQQRIFLNESSI